MNVRRFEHPTKHRFWEAYWDLSDVETVSGTIGSNGRTTRREFATALELKRYLELEIGKRIKEGFEEVVPEVVRNQSAPVAPPPPPELLQRILEAPDDDQPRMVYADWLQTHGDPLGELISLQLQIARIPAGTTVPKKLRDRESSLMAGFRARWLPGFVDAHVTFVRGFAEAVKLELPFERDLLDRLMAVSPLLRTLVIAHPRNPYYWMSRRPWELASPEALRRLTGLWMGGFQMNDEGVDALAQADLPHLERLGLRAMALLPSQWKRLADRAWVELDLHASSLGARGMEYLIARDRSGLRALDVGSNEIGDAGLAHLVSIPLPALRALSLRRSKLTVKALPLLAKLTMLETLDISHNAGIHEAAVREALPRVRIVTRMKNVG